MALLGIPAATASAQITPAAAVTPPDDTPSIRVGVTWLAADDVRAAKKPCAVDRGRREDAPDATASSRTTARRRRHASSGSRVGHAFPTYVTPRVVLAAELLDPAGNVLPGSREELVIGREVALDLSRELRDTRLMPGRVAELTYRRPAAGATRVRLSVVVEPDAFYTRFFEALLAQGAGRGEAQIREAFEATRRSTFTVFERDIPLT